eukprot:8304190-Alexandrium_andersonii.AAC.1
MSTPGTDQSKGRLRRRPGLAAPPTGRPKGPSSGGRWQVAEGAAHASGRAGLGAPQRWLAAPPS